MLQCLLGLNSSLRDERFFSYKSEKIKTSKILVSKVVDTADLRMRLFTIRNDIEDIIDKLHKLIEK